MLPFEIKADNRARKGMLARLLLRLEITNRGSALERTEFLDRSRAVQQRLRNHGLTATPMTHESNVSDVFGSVGGHPGSLLENRSRCYRDAITLYQAVGGGKQRGIHLRRWTDPHLGQVRSGQVLPRLHLLQAGDSAFELEAFSTFGIESARSSGRGHDQIDVSVIKLVDQSDESLSTI